MANEQQSISFPSAIEQTTALRARRNGANGRAVFLEGGWGIRTYLDDSKQPVIPEGLVVSYALAEAGWRHAGDPAYLSPHMRLIGKTSFRSNCGEIGSALARNGIPADKGLLDSDKQLQVTVALTGPVANSTLPLPEAPPAE